MSSSVVLITGALSGIGRAAAVAFAKADHRVVVSGRKQDAGQALVRELRSLGAEAEFVQADVQNEDDVRRLVDRTVERFGRLDIAVNNAGTEGQVGPITDQTAESYAATFDTNVLGAMLSMKHEVRVMKAEGAAASSTSPRPTGMKARRGLPSMSRASTPSKASPSRWRSKSRSRGFRVNAVAPGPTDTGMLTRFTGTPENKAALAATVPMGRLGLTEELANAIVFLAPARLVHQRPHPQRRWR